MRCDLWEQQGLWAWVIRDEADNELAAYTEALATEEEARSELREALDDLSGVYNNDDDAYQCDSTNINDYIYDY